MPWFERNHNGRPLFPHERQFVAELKQLLSEVAAPQVDESETVLTGEGTHCLIVLIPHRALGGISIVVWLFKDRAEVTWAQVADLDCCHDSLDLGISVSHFRLHPNQPDFGAVLECIRRQLSEPLTFRVFDDHSATVLIRDHWGELRELGDVGAVSLGRKLLRLRALTQETQIRFTDPSSPPVTAPSGVDNWFGSRDAHDQ